MNNKNNYISKWKTGGDDEETFIKTNPKEQLTYLSSLLVNSTHQKFKEYELEAKFGTKGFKPLTKMDYDNVIKKLKSMGFELTSPDGEDTLKIQLEILDVKTGQFKTAGNFDRFRIEVVGLDNIQEYCRTNDLKTINDKTNFQYVQILRKTDVMVKKEGSDEETYAQPAEFDDFNFRVTYKLEERINKYGKIGMEIFNNWNQTKKIFRYVKRISFLHDDYPIRVDLSIVKSSSKNERRRYIQTYNIEESNVFQNPESYEIELEVVNNRAQSTFKNYTKEPKLLANSIQELAKIVLSGLQGTNYPISLSNQKQVIRDYFTLLYEEEYKKRNEKYKPKEYAIPKDFLGPNSKALQIENIGPINSNIIVPNITEPYSFCVTEKADGERHLLYIANDGKIYLINTSMSVIFTGAFTMEERCFNSILDGELILHDKFGNFINTFASFDLYFYNKIDVRHRPFIKTPLKEDKYFEEGCRLPMLKEFIKILTPKNINQSQNPNRLMKCPIKITSKKFYPLFNERVDQEQDLEKDKKKNEKKLEEYDIYRASNFILKMIQDNLFEYEVDGLIFTPTLFGVGSNKFLEAGPKYKITWEYSFKWKPNVASYTFPKSYLTIDFLITTKKGPDGNDLVTPVFENGMKMGATSQYNSYKTLILAVGYDETKHGYINPCQDVLDDRIKGPSNGEEDEEKYKPKQFYPSDPADPLGGLCNIMLQMDSNGNMQLFTEEGQIIEDKMVVEFRYDMDKQGLWRWIPLRVRYDKTSDFRQGHNSFGNDYTTANSNWYSIHNPVTEYMIGTGKDIPTREVSDDVYYNSTTNERLTLGLRDFHNLYVKKKLIQGVSKKGNILIDLACGKAGDLPKWVSSNLSFVFGIDIAKDNIENRLNGACARYLNYKRTNSSVPYALFVNGNSALNIRSGTNMFTDKANQIVKAIFGEGSKNTSLGPAVTRQYSRGANGFDVTSCQFAIHYMFKDNKSFYNFIRNVAECTRLNGYFIATCYDGRTIFNLLRNKEQGESVEKYADGKKVWSVTKDYDGIKFENDESSLGYKISVYQDTINNSIDEYLVNYDFLVSTMEKYGFSLASREETKYMGLPEGSGMFIELYNMMLNEIKKDPSKEKEYKSALNMKQYEKDISFLNRYFVFKKTSSRNAEKLTKAILEQLPDEISFENAGTILARESVKEAEEEIKPKVKNLRKKIMLQEATEALDEQDQEQIQQPKEVIQTETQPQLAKTLRKSVGRPKKVKETIEFVIEEE
uniref:mRNA cap 0 methyltransferase domain-containing protein n=1 Tax=viral metagenome TaxID=1070528 RepID=A0A6C0ISM5_9ZZZZ